MDLPTAEPSDPRMRPPTRFVVWTLRLLALSGLSVALFLSAIHVLAWVQTSRVNGIYCKLPGLEFLDCDTVLNSEWGTWFGIPVSMLGSLAYVFLLAGLFTPLHATPPVRAGHVWGWLCAVSLAIAGAALWFIYLQTAALDRTYCLWCMAEHVIGLALFALIWLHAFAAGAIHRRQALGGWVIGGLAVGVLIVGQHMDTHVYVQRGGPLVGVEDGMGGYSEFTGEPPPGALRMRKGALTLDPAKHLLLGRREAERVVVEAVDYTCPGCKRLTSMIAEVRPLLGPQYAYLIITTPLDSDCNKYFARDYEGKTDAQHQHACDLAELAQAVWLADPLKFEEYHGWLFENQVKMSGLQPEEAVLKAKQMVQAARAKAVEVVGEEALEASLAEGKAGALITRDIEIAEKLGVGQLPGLFANDQVFNAIPEESDTLAQQLLMVFRREP